MGSKHDQAFDKNKPALVLLYGETNKKHRALDREVILIGRARGCDLGLEAPDISSAHCLIHQGPAGYTLRDCQSRSGTKLNGSLCKEGLLRDGDLIQIGPFSFRVHLPAGCNGTGAAAPAGSRLDHLERSRRNLARLALQQRQQLRLTRVCKTPVNGATRPDSRVGKQASALKARVKDYEQRMRALENAERELSRDRETLDQEQAVQRARLQQGEERLAQWKRDAEAEIAAKHKELEELAQQHEAERAATAAAAAEAQVDPGAQSDPLAQEREALQQHGEELEQLADELQLRSRQLDEKTKQVQEQAEQQQRDLEAQARHLEHREKQLAAAEAVPQQQQKNLEAQERQFAERCEELAAKVRNLERDQREFSMTREQWLTDQQAFLARVGQHKSAIAQAEETLRDHRMGLDDLLANLQDLRASSEQAAESEVEQLRHDNEQLRLSLSQRSTRDVADGQLLALRHENEDLKHLLAAMERERERAEAAVAEAIAAAPSAPSSAECEMLRKQLAAKEAEMRQFLNEAEEAMGRTDMVYLESQLVEYRRQLETDRQKLNHEIDLLRARNKELNEATRDMEMEMSRERAELARERQRLERLRDDVRLELDRIQRESGMRERLAPVQSLRDEMNSKRQPLNDQTPKPTKEDPVAARIRGLRNRMNES